MMGIGFFELVIIAVVCLIAVGPKQLPQVMKNLAIFYRKFNNLREDLKFQVLSVDHEEHKLEPSLDAKNHGFYSGKAELNPAESKQLGRSHHG